MHGFLGGLLRTDVSETHQCVRACMRVRARVTFIAEHRSPPRRAIAGFHSPADGLWEPPHAPTPGLKPLCTILPDAVGGPIFQFSLGEHLGGRCGPRSPLLAPKVGTLPSQAQVAPQPRGGSSE